MGREQVQEELDAEVVAEPSQALAGLDSISRGEIDLQIATAKRFPRDVAKVARDIVAMATINEEVAASCFYSLKRTDKDGGNRVILGPSIRLAEIALSVFGNVRAGTRSMGETEDGRFVKELGFCWDVEKNVAVAREVKRRITTRTGKRFGDDMIGVTMAAAGAIALRNSVLTVVPRALVTPAFDAAREVAVGKAKSLTKQVAAVLAKLSKLSPLITTDRVLAERGKKSIAELDWEDVEQLIGLGTSIKDGQISVEDAFPDPTKDDVSEGARTAAEVMSAAAEPPQAKDSLQEGDLEELKEAAEKAGFAWSEVEKAATGVRGLGCAIAELRGDRAVLKAEVVGLIRRMPLEEADGPQDGQLGLE